MSTLPDCPCPIVVSERQRSCQQKTLGSQVRSLQGCYGHLELSMSTASPPALAHPLPWTCKHHRAQPHPWIQVCLSHRDYDSSPPRHKPQSNLLTPKGKTTPIFQQDGQRRPQSNHPCLLPRWLPPFHCLALGLPWGTPALPHNP
jgi:hypothetical protein